MGLQLSRIEEEQGDKMMGPEVAHIAHAPAWV